MNFKLYLQEEIDKCEREINSAINSRQVEYFGGKRTALKNTLFEFKSFYDDVGLKELQAWCNNKHCDDCPLKEACNYPQNGGVGFCHLEVSEIEKKVRNERKDI